MLLILLQVIGQFCRCQIFLLHENVAQQVGSIFVFLVHFEDSSTYAQIVDDLRHERLSVRNVAHAADFSYIIIDARYSNGMKATAYTIVGLEKKNLFIGQRVVLTKTIGQIGTGRPTSDDDDVLDVGGIGAETVRVVVRRVEGTTFSRGVVGVVFFSRCHNGNDDEDDDDAAGQSDSQNDRGHLIFSYVSSRRLTRVVLVVVVEFLHRSIGCAPVEVRK